MPPASIFISYRKQDSERFATRLSETLSVHFEGRIDINDAFSPQGGDDLRQHLFDQILACQVMLVIIGSQYLIKNGLRSRLFDTDDYVRFEVATGLDRYEKGQMIVIPILLNGARMPRANQLPAVMRGLPSIKAHGIDDGRPYAENTADLIDLIDRKLSEFQFGQARRNPPELSSKVNNVIRLNESKISLFVLYVTVFMLFMSAIFLWVGSSRLNEGNAAMTALAETNSVEQTKRFPGNQLTSVPPALTFEFGIEARTTATYIAAILQVTDTAVAIYNQRVTLDAGLTRTKTITASITENAITPNVTNTRPIDATEVSLLTSTSTPSPTVILTDTPTITTTPTPSCVHQIAAGSSIITVSEIAIANQTAQLFLFGDLNSYFEQKPTLAIQNGWQIQILDASRCIGRTPLYRIRIVNPVNPVDSDGWVDRENLIDGFPNT